MFFHRPTWRLDASGPACAGETEEDANDAIYVKRAPFRSALHFTREPASDWNSVAGSLHKTTAVFCCRDCCPVTLPHFLNPRQGSGGLCTGSGKACYARTQSYPRRLADSSRTLVSPQVSVGRGVGFSTQRMLDLPKRRPIPRQTNTDTFGHQIRRRRSVGEKLWAMLLGSAARAPVHAAQRGFRRRHKVLAATN